MARNAKNRAAEGTWLGNLGNRYAALGDGRKAIEFYEQALVIDREIGNRRSEEVALGNLGECYFELGDTGKAIEHYEQALAIDREISAYNDEASDLVNISYAFLSLGELQKAKENYKQAIQIADEISFSAAQINARCGLAQAYLFQNDLVNARATIEAALQFDVPSYNHNITALHGIIALRQGDASAASQAFPRAIAQADEILAKTPDYYSALDAKGLALCGFILAVGGGLQGITDAPSDAGTRHNMTMDSIRRPAPTITDAIETFCAARKIAPHAGVVKSVLRLFDELSQCDEEGILKEVREAVEGK